ncbi:MAG TPA: hypothetical protein VF459_07125, partial [Caulobacteraceae bacterium]
MFRDAPPPPDAAEPAPEPVDPAQAQRDHELAMLAALADAAMALAMSFQKKALAAVETAATREEDAAAAGYGRAFDRAARTVRQCLALKARFAAEHELTRRKAAEARAAAEAAQAADEELVSNEITARRATAILTVKAAIDAQKRPRAEKENLYDAIEEVLEPFGEEMFLRLPIGQIAQALCKALGVSLDLAALQDEAWAREE